MKRKGFTLTELIVTLAVSGIVLASVFSVIIAISSYNHIRNEKNMVNEEMTLNENRIKNWFSANDLSSNSAPVVSMDNSRLTFGEEVAEFISAEGTLILGEDVYETRFTVRISFEQAVGNDNLIKCTMSYKTEKLTDEREFLLLKRSVTT